MYFHFLGMVISFYLAQCILCTFLMLTPTSSWRLHNKFNEPGTSQEDPYGLKRMSRTGPRVMVTRSELAPALVEDEYAEYAAAYFVCSHVYLFLAKGGLILLTEVRD